MRVILIFILISISSLSAATKEKKTVLIFDFQNISGSKKFSYLRQSIPDSMGTSFVKEGEFNIIRRNVWQKIVKELKIDITRTLDEDQAIAIGRTLKADAVVYGSFFIVGNFIRINAKAINLYTGKIITGVQVQGETGLNVFELVDEVTGKITAEVKKEFIHIEKMRNIGKNWVGSVMRSAVLPGWGQLYNRQRFKAYIFWGIGGVLLASVVSSHFLYQNAKEEYDNLQVVPQDVYDEKYNQADKYYQFRKYSIIAFLVFYTGNIIDAGIVGAIKYEKEKTITFIPDKDCIRIAMQFKL